MEWKADGRKEKVLQEKLDEVLLIIVITKRNMKGGDQRLTPCLRQIGRGKKHDVNGSIHF